MIMRNTYWFTIALLSIITLKANAQQATANIPAELQQLTKQAIGYFPKLKEGQENLLIGDAKVRLSQSGYLPTAYAGFTYNYINPIGEAKFGIPGAEKTIQFVPHNNFNTAINLSQNIYDFGRTKGAVDKAKAEQQQIKDNVTANENNIAYQVANIYYHIIFLNKNIVVIQQQLKLAQDNLKLVESKIKNGDALEYDRLSSDVRVKTAENKIVDAKSQLKKQLNLLNYLTGGAAAIADTTLFTMDAITGTEEAYKSAATLSSDIVLAKDKMMYNQADLKATNKGLLPYLTFNGSVGFKNGYQPDINQWRFNYAVGGGLTIPIYDGGRTLTQRKIARLNIEAARQNVLYAEGTLKKDIEQIMADISSNKEKLGNSAALVKQATLALNLAQSRYKNGVLTILELQNSESSLQDAQLAQIQINYQLALNYLELSRLGGVRFW